jgi:hypothetical protein
LNTPDHAFELLSDAIKAREWFVILLDHDSAFDPLRRDDRFADLIYTHLKKLPVHKAMLEVSELIYETCKTYLVTQGKFILILEAFIAVIIALYFGLLFFCSVLWALLEATALRGSASASTPSPTRGLPLRASRANLIPFTPSR